MHGELGRRIERGLYDIPSSSLCMGSWGGGLRGAYIMCPVHGELGKRLTNSSYSTCEFVCRVLRSLKLSIPATLPMLTGALVELCSM